MWKIWRSPYSHYAGAASNHPDEMTDETITANLIYTDAELAGIAKSGFNAIWVHGLLHHMIRVSPFPELGKNEEAHLKNLRELQLRAKKYGLKLFIYLQPPRAIEMSFTEFWNKHADISGREINFYNGANVKTLCTSTAQVKEWLTNASAKLVKSLPDLGGLIIITASEFPSHCLNIPGGTVCSRCKNRSLAEVIAEIIGCIHKGIKSSKSDATIIAWNWYWNQDDYENIISQLPREVLIMGDFERGGYRTLPDSSRFFYNEYSLSFPGPSESFTQLRKCAEKFCHKTMSKLQLGTTHELASVVNLPLISSIYEKATYLRNNKGAGYLGCWNFGNMQSSNVHAFNFFINANIPGDKNSAILEFARHEFPNGNPLELFYAWEIFSEAMLHYPFSIPFLYYGPQNYTLAYWQMYKPATLEGTPAGRSWHLDERGDDLSKCYGDFTPEQIIEKIDKVSVIWERGLDFLRKGLNGQYPLELGNAEVICAVWKSTANTFKIACLRKNWHKDKYREFIRIVDDELNVLKNVLFWTELDQRQGFHCEPQGYMFNSKTIAIKIKKLNLLKLKWSETQARAVCC